MLRFHRLALCTPLFLLIVFSSCSFSPAKTEARALDRGKKLLKNRDYSRALLEFKNAIKVMPKDPEASYQAGLAALGQGDTQGAFQYFNSAVRLDPKHTGAQLKIAEMMATSRNRPLIEEAEKHLDEMLPDSSSNPELLDALAVAEAQLGKPEEAVRHLQQALEKSPSDLSSSINLAQIKLAYKDVAGAETVLRRAVEQDPKSASAALALAQLYLKLNRPTEAQAQVQRAIAIDPQNGPALFTLAAIQVQAGSKDAAEQTYAKLALLPDKRYKSLHAISLLRNQRTDAAIAEFEKLAKAEPNDRDARTLLVEAYASVGKTDQARKVLSDALQKNAKDVDALLERSQLDLQSGQTASAAADLRQVLKFRPDSAEAHFGLARVYAASGSRLSRQQELSEALKLKPGLTPARTALIQALLQENQPTAALDIVNQTPDDQKNLLPLVVARIWALRASGDDQSARKELDQRLAVARIPELVFQDATLKLWRKDYSGAQVGATEVLKQNPLDVRALRVLLDSYVGQKKDAEADRSIRTAASQQPKSAPIQKLLGDWMVGRANLTQAREAYVAAEAADSAYVDASLALSDLDRLAGKPDSARHTLSGVLSRDPNNQAALLRLAALEERAGNLAASIQNLQTVVAADSSNVMALNNLAYLTAKTDPDRALKYAEQAAGLVPQNAAIEDTLGYVYYRKGLYSLAVTHLEIAVKKDGTPRRRFHLGLAYTKAGDSVRGRQFVAAALQLDPKLSESEKDWITA